MLVKIDQPDIKDNLVRTYYQNINTITLFIQVMTDTTQSYHNYKPQPILLITLNPYPHNIQHFYIKIIYNKTHQHNTKQTYPT